IPAGGVRADGRAGQAIGHRMRVRKERGLLEFRTPRPEADADLLGIAAYPPNDAGIGWRLGRTTGEPRQRQVEGAPPERHRCRPPTEPAPMFPEDEVDPRQQPPEAVSPVGLVIPVDRVLWKRYRGLHLGWRGRDPVVDPERAQPAHQSCIELPTRPGP